MKALLRHLVAFLLGATLVGTTLVASDRPKDPDVVAAAEKAPRFADIPQGRILVPLPSVAQPDGYSCGAASLMSICEYYGVGEDTIREFKKKVRSDRVNGTYYGHMVSYAHTLGLEADPIRDMTLRQLEQRIGDGKPVICSIQAYGKPGRYNQDESGHYVVAIGFDEHNFYFMDPSIPADNRRRGFIERDDFDRRWHDDEAQKGDPPERIHHLGIVVYPKQGHTAFLLKALRIP